MNKREPKLSQTDYVNREGRECPWCESISIMSHDHWSKGAKLFYAFSCTDCDAYWVEDYKLLGYREVK